MFEVLHVVVTAYQTSGDPFMITWLVVGSFILASILGHDPKPAWRRNKRLSDSHFSRETKEPKTFLGS